MAKSRLPKAKQTRLTQDGRLEDAPDGEVVQIKLDDVSPKLRRKIEKSIRVHPDQLPLLEIGGEITKFHTEERNGMQVRVIDNIKLREISLPTL